MLVGAFFLWQIKHDSAVGRLLLWKISALAIADAPFFGNENFASAYGAAQEKYFASNDASISEKLAAGSPDYAFNEYLQIGVEYGLLVLIFELVILGFIIRKSYREKTFGLSGALLSLSPKGEMNGYARTVNSDENGSFTFGCIEDGEYLLSWTKNGYGYDRKHQSVGQLSACTQEGDGSVK